MQTTIRLLTASDVQAYRLLRLFSLQSDPLAFSESYEDRLNSTDEDFVKELEIIGTPEEKFTPGAFDEHGTLLGFVRFVRDARSKARHKAFIHGMYVKPGYRSMAVGKLLMDNLLQRASLLANLEQIHLWVLHSGTSAAGFYRKCGFKSQGTLVKADLKIGTVYVDAEYMVLYFE